MPKTLVTGGMGFIGLHVVRQLLDAGEDVVITWNRSWRVPEFWADDLGKRVIAERVDVANPHEVSAAVVKHKVDSIIHAAAPGFGASSLTQDYATHLQGLINVIEAANLASVRRLTFLSSSTLYQGLAAGPYREDAPLPLESRNATEAFKKAGEALLFHYADRMKLDVATVRPRQVYGPMYYSMANLPSRLCHAAVKGALPDYGAAGPPFAEDTGDFTNVHDCAEVVRLVHLAPSLRHRVYNVGGGRAVTMQELADTVRKQMPDAKIELKPGENPRGNPPANYLDLSRLKDEFNFAPRYPVEAGIPDYIAWLATHPQ
ncbi:MAG TPA: NAD(P)-dependent oxidoreductase [Dehalococcoidia bacterium]|nr:NAD(P)-dependent oxidoreductase [Dehalococcoidia bacterium]